MKQHTSSFIQLVEEAKTHIKETNVDAVRHRQLEGEHICLIDVREDREWVSGHLPGAIHLGKGVIERDIEQIIADKKSEIILYCGGGYRSALAALSLKKMGYTQVVSMDGGFHGWAERDFPIERN